jgi:hypothetical protein
MHLAMLDASMLAYGVMYNLLPIMTTWLGYGESDLVGFVIGLLGVFVPQLFMVAAYVEGRRSREALDALARFSLDDVQCYAPEDKAEILRMIGSWFTDTSTGESDPEVLQQIGHHRFTTFVRYNLRLHIQKGLNQGLSPRTKLLGLTVTLPWLFDIAASPDVSVPEVLVQSGVNTLAWMLIGFELWFWALAKFADVAAHAIERGWWGSVVYTAMTPPLVVFIVILSAAATALSGVPFVDAVTTPRSSLLGGDGVTPEADERSIKMGMMLILATLLQPFVTMALAAN